ARTCNSDHIGRIWTTGTYCWRRWGGTNRMFVADPAWGTVGQPMATMLISPLHARLTGQAARRGLIPRVPSADALLADVETWLGSTFSEAVRSVEGPVRASGG